MSNSRTFLSSPKEAPHPLELLLLILSIIYSLSNSLLPAAAAMSTFFRNFGSISSNNLLSYRNNLIIDYLVIRVSILTTYKNVKAWVKQRQSSKGPKCKVKARNQLYPTNHFKKGFSSNFCLFFLCIL